MTYQANAVYGNDMNCPEQENLINYCITKCVEREPDLRFMHFDYVMRAVMQESRGQANPAIAKEIITNNVLEVHC